MSALGTFLHFAYELSGNNFFVGLFTPTSESVWEHTKLIFFPMLFYGLYLSKKLKTSYPCITSAMLFGTLLGVLLIIALFYIYSGIIGTHIAFVDIAIFYISVIIAFYTAYRLTLSCSVNEYHDLLWFLNAFLTCLFLIFTVFPPNIALFMVP